MRVEDSSILRDDGTVASLHGLAAPGPVALVFLRHLGCLFCREQVATLRDALPEANVAFVTMAEPKLAARFRTWLKSPHGFVCDPDRALYRAFGLERATPRQILGPRVLARGASAFLAGHRQAASGDEDAWQLGGTFVMDGEGCVTAAFPAADAGDHPSPEALSRALQGTAREVRGSES